MDTVDTVEKAYILGCIATGDLVEKETRIVVTVEPSYQDIIDKLSAFGFCTLETNKFVTTLTNSSSKIFHDVCKHLGCNTDTFPEFKENKLQWAFLRGLFDMCCSISSKVLKNGVRLPQLKVIPPSQNLMHHICETCGVPYMIEQHAIVFEGTNCMDMLGKLYKTSTPETRLKTNFEKFVNLSTLGYRSTLPVCEVFKVDDKAVLPSKEKMSDVGYDLTIIKESKKWHSDITLYDTGVRINIEHGYYAEVVPRSSLSKSGYMLANSVGIIDPSYRGNILVALVKVDKSAPDLELPFRCCQLIFKKQVNMDIQEVYQDFDTTTRGDGGFGSTS